jgi:hypothetical protein
MKFERSSFLYSSMWLTYVMPDGTNQFIARFRAGNKNSKASFLTFLINNFSVEEYVERLEVRREAPLTILESKGYVSPNMKKAAKLRELAAAFRVAA